MQKRHKLLIIGAAILITAVVAGFALHLSVSQDGRFRPLTEADRYELFSLDPALDPISSEERTIERLHGYKILGSTLVTDPNIRKTLNTAFIEGVKHAGDPKACMFEPRHAIRVTKNDVMTDYLICFKCGDVALYRGSKVMESWTIDHTPEQAFDKVLTDAGVKLASKAK